MSIETSVIAAIKTCCARVFPDVAPVGTARPFATWQGIGGAGLRFVEGTAADKRNVIYQINVWSETRLEALSIARQIEDALCAASDISAEPFGEPISVYEEDTGLYGCQQRISVWASR